MNNLYQDGWKEAYIEVADIKGKATLKFPHEDEILFLDDESMKDYSTFRTNLGRFHTSFTGMPLTTTYYDSDNDELPMDSECEFNEAMRIVKDRTKRGQCTLLHVTPAVHSSARYASERENFHIDMKQRATIQVQAPIPVDFPCSSQNNDYSKTGHLTNQSKHESKENEEPPAWFIKYMDKFKEEILSSVENIVSTHQSVCSLGVPKDGELPLDKSCIKSMKIFRDDPRDPVSMRLDPASEGHLLRKIEKLHKREKKLERKVDIKLEKMELKTKRKMEKKAQKQLHLRKENESQPNQLFTPSRQERAKEIGSPTSSRPVIRAHICNAWTNHRIPFGSQFTQTWHLKNSGDVPWTKVELRLVACKPGMLPESRIIKCPNLDVGEKGHIIAKFQEPDYPGFFVSIWQLFDQGISLANTSVRCGVIVEPDVKTSKDEKKMESVADAEKIVAAGNSSHTMSYPETGKQWESIGAVQQEPSASPSAPRKVEVVNESLKENSVIGCEVKPETDKEPTYEELLMCLKFSPIDKVQCDTNGDTKDGDGGDRNKADDNNEKDVDEDIHDDEISILSGEISITESDSDDSQDTNDSKFVVVPMPSCFNTNENLSGHSNAESFININGNADAETGESSKESITTATTQKLDSSAEMPPKSQINSTVNVDSFGRCMPVKDMNTKQSNSKRSAADDGECSSEVDQGIKGIKGVKSSTLDHSGCCCDVSGIMLQEKILRIQRDHDSFTKLTSKELKVGQESNPYMRNTTAGKCGSSNEICESTMPSVSQVAKNKCGCFVVKQPENLVQDFKEMALMRNEDDKELQNKERIVKNGSRQEQGCQTAQEVKPTESLAKMAKMLKEKQTFLTTSLSAQAHSCDEPVTFLPEKLVNIAASAISTACNVLGSLGKPPGLPTEQEPRAAQLPQSEKHQVQLYPDGRHPGIPVCGAGFQGLQYFSGSHADGLYPGLYLRGAPVSASNAKEVQANTSHMHGPQCGWEYAGYVYPGQMFSNGQQPDNHMRADHHPGDKHAADAHPLQINIGGNQIGQHASNEHNPVAHPFQISIGGNQIGQHASSELNPVKQIQSQQQPSQQHPSQPYLNQHYFRAQNLTPQLSGQGLPLIEFTGSKTPTRPCYLVPYQGSPGLIPNLNHSNSPRIGVFNPTSVSQTPLVPTAYSDLNSTLTGHNNKSIFAGTDSHSTSVSQTPLVPTAYSDLNSTLTGHNNKSIFAGTDSHSDQSKRSYRFDFMSGRDLDYFDGTFKPPGTSSQVKVSASQNSTPMQPLKPGQSESSGSISVNLL